MILLQLLGSTSKIKVKDCVSEACLQSRTAELKPNLPLKTLVLDRSVYDQYIQQLAMLGCMLKASCFQVPVMLPPLEVLMFS
jgi:hypothetical protein